MSLPAGVDIHINSQHTLCSYNAPHLFEDHSISVELLSSLCSADDLGGHGEAEGRQLPDLSQQRHQTVTVVHT